MTSTCKQCKWWLVEDDEDEYDGTCDCPLPLWANEVVSSISCARGEFMDYSTHTENCPYFENKEDNK